MYEWDIDVVEINILTPYPGTPLYDRLEREKRIISKDWSRYNQVDVVYEPKNMSGKELFEGARKVAKEFYSVSNVVGRMLKTMANIRRISSIIPAGSNLTFRKYYKRDFNF